MPLHKHRQPSPFARIFLIAFLLFCLAAPRMLAAAELQAGEVPASSASDAMQLDLIASGDRFFVGEGIVLELRWRSRLPWQSFRDVELDLPLLASRSFDNFDFVSRPAVWEEVGMPLANTRVLAYASPSTGKDDWRTIRIFKVFVPRRAGVYAIDGVELRCAVLPQGSSLAQDWGRYPSYFDNNFFEREVPDSAHLARVEAEPLRIEVEALPPGPSVSDALAVCARFDASVEARPRTVAAGDPIHLRLRIAGDAVPESVKRPRLEHILSSHGFEVDSEPATPEFDEDAVVLKYGLRAASDDVEQIPVLELLYFDRNSKNYKRVETEAVPLEVAPAPRIGIDDAVRAERGFGGKIVAVSTLSLLAIAASIFIILRSRKNA